MKKKLIAVVLAAFLFVLLMPSPKVGAISYNDPGISTNASIDIQFPWDVNSLIYGDTGVCDLNIAIGAGILSASVELGTYNEP